jgi:hypothetical protein
MSETIIPKTTPAPVAEAIFHFIKAATNFAIHLRATTENNGQPISVPSEAMTGFLMMLDFIHSKPKGIVINEDAIRAGMKPIIFDMEMIPLLIEYIASEAGNNPCDCPVCTAHKEAQALDESAAVAVKH